MPKTMTLRLTDQLAADLEAMARVDDVPVSEAIRAAIDERIKARREDKQFQARLRRADGREPARAGAAGAVAAGPVAAARGPPARSQVSWLCGGLMSWCLKAAPSCGHASDRARRARAAPAARGAARSRARPGRACCCACAPCGVCRTDLHLRDGELPPAHLPLVLGHQIVGEVARRGGTHAAARASACRGWAGRAANAASAAAGARTCATRARFTGTDIDGGYAELAVADARFCLPLPPGRPPGPPGRAAAVRRADRLPRAADGGRRERLGLYGFGAAAHIDLPGGRARRARGVRVHAAGRRGRAGVRARAGRRRGPARADERAAGAARRRDRLRARRGRSSRRAARARAGRHGRLRGHPHERHPVVPLRAAVGRALDPLGRQPDARATARSSSRSRRGSRCARPSPRTRSRPPSRRSTTCAPGAFEGAAVLTP